jgi:long-subunit acyl-CoA synthetase (AMP-forming)
MKESERTKYKNRWRRVRYASAGILGAGIVGLAVALFNEEKRDYIPPALAAMAIGGTCLAVNEYVVHLDRKIEDMCRIARNSRNIQGDLEKDI